MLYGAFRFLAVRLSICVIFAGAFLHAICPVDEIVVSGRVENAPVKSSVLLLPAAAAEQLLYPNLEPLRPEGRRFSGLGLQPLR
jgi:hypothetical protein